jgi:hypothetical protein
MPETEKAEPMTLYIMRRRFRAALAYSTMDAAQWATAHANVTVQHLNAVLRGDRPMTDELKEKLESFIAEQFAMMRQEEGAAKLADVVISATAAEFADLIARAFEKLFEDRGSIDIDASETEQIDLLGKQLGEWMALLHQQDREKESLEREALNA